MRWFMVVAAIGLLAAAPATSSPAKTPEITQTLETRVGEVVFLKLPGNPDLGYKWRVNEARSTGLGLVSVDQIGWLMAPAERSIFFRAQSVLNVSVKANAAGQADIAFDYYRYTGGRMLSRTSAVRVIIKPRPVSR